MSERADILENWLSHPGTALFFQHVEEEWGAGGKRFEASIDRFIDSREDDQLILRQIQQIAVCRREMLNLQRWAPEELARLKHAEPPRNGTAGPRRRELAASLVKESRRGGL